MHKIDPGHPLALFDHWLEERAFVNRKHHNFESYYEKDVEKDATIEILRPHGKEWLFSLASGKGENGLKLKLWGPGMIEHGMIDEFNLADPNSFDAITSTISAWRRTKHAALKEVWRYIKVVEHRTRANATIKSDAWVVLMAADYFKLHGFHEDYQRMRSALKAHNIEIPVSESNYDAENI